jgi:hypothetical protein
MADSIEQVRTVDKTWIYVINLEESHLFVPVLNSVSLCGAVRLRRLETETGQGEPPVKCRECQKIMAGL